MISRCLNEELEDNLRYNFDHLNDQNVVSQATIYLSNEYILTLADREKDLLHRL